VPPKIRLLLVDDHALLREGLRAMLSFYEEFQVVGEAQDGEEALAKVSALQPDVVLMDIAMKGMNGLEATRAISQNHPKVRVLIVSQHEDRQYILSLLQAGASGYILKRALGADLVSAIRTVQRGENYLHPSVSTIVLDEMLGKQRVEADSPDALTQRESQVLKYIVQGMTNSQIALTLSLSAKTVDWHRTHLMNKLDVHNVADLVRYALKHGLVEDNS
jgi:DNA-binding NarL/FixJ family response regulator